MAGRLIHEHHPGHQFHYPPRRRGCAIPLLPSGATGPGFDPRRAIPRSDRQTQPAAPCPTAPKGAPGGAGRAAGSGGPEPRPPDTRVVAKEPRGATGRLRKISRHPPNQPTNQPTNQITKGSSAPRCGYSEREQFSLGAVSARACRGGAGACRHVPSHVSGPSASATEPAARLRHSHCSCSACDMPPRHRPVAMMQVV